MTERGKPDHFTIPPEDKPLLDSLGVDLEMAYRAYSYGRLRGRSDAYEAIAGLPSVFGAFDHERLTFDGPKLEAVEPDRGDAA